MLTTLAAKITAAQTAGNAPDPTPVRPPGGEDFAIVLNWVFWIALAAGVLGFIIAGIMMMLQSSGRMGGDGGQHMARVGWVAVGCIVVAAASGLTNQFI